MEDRRPDPKPRRHAKLHQAYTVWDEFMQMRKKHLLRKDSIDKGKSNCDGAFEDEIIATLDVMIEDAKETMVTWGEQVSIWHWLTSIKGIGEHTAAKLIALIDWPGPMPEKPDNFSTISKLWRYAGHAVINGEIERPAKGEELHYNKRLKSELRLVATNFLKHQTLLYSDYYYQQKAKDREKHPQVICTNCGHKFEPEHKSCPECGQTNKGHGLTYCKAHMDARAKRKTIKLFLSHLWLVWRELEGLPLSEPYISAVGGHTNIIPPPRFD